MSDAPNGTEVVVPLLDAPDEWARAAGAVKARIPSASIVFKVGWGISIRQPNGPDVVALAGETLRIAAGRVERVKEDERHD